ncbi:hypothetical protein FA95DRAFT_1562279 [Auriscalpium vulgare]|uniref:Uncharacterized protein n=1 Tax=Auriscalpium vulgare TaxID=40419 RepID=A0ACB8RKI6_9AGAM|nr:hypothetical protein FA95DRAFT_1562279 [Auriscalpium vulgare]
MLSRRRHGPSHTAHSAQQPPAPALRLPVELLSRVFLLGFDNGIDPRYPFKRRPLEPTTTFEVLVSHVCHHWRSVALHTPCLWTSIRLRKGSHITRAKTFLKRSQSVLLDVFLEIVAPHDHISGHTLSLAELDDAFDTITPHSSRWSSFIVRVNDMESKEAARRHLRRYLPIPSLKTMQLWHLEDWGTAQNLWASNTRPPVPLFYKQELNIRHVSLVGINLLWAQSGYLSGLTQLELALHSEAVRPSGEDWETIMRNCPDLERLSLHYSGPRAHLISPERAVALLRLTNLSLTDIDLDVVLQLIRQMEMPNVRALKLELPDQDFSPLFHRLSKPDHIVFPHLERLCITALDCEPDPWRAFLACTSSITRLEMDFRRVPVDLFEALLTNVPSPGPFSDIHGESLCVVRLPSLQELKVAGLPSNGLTKFVSFRADAGYPVPRCWVHHKLRNEATDSLSTQTEVEYFVYSDDDDDADDDDDECSYREVASGDLVSEKELLMRNPVRHSD